MIVFRHADPRYPFLWEDRVQPAARWHADGEGPVHYFCDTPDGAWAELLRHEEIRMPEDLATIRRALWAVQIDDDPGRAPDLPPAMAVGSVDSYPRCQAEARRLRAEGMRRLVAPSAALRPGEARGWHVDGGLRAGPVRDGQVVVLFGRQPDAIGWAATIEGRPPQDLLAKVRHFE